MERLKKITLEDVIFFALVVFAIASCFNAHLAKNTEQVAIALGTIHVLRGGLDKERFRIVKQFLIVCGIYYGTMLISAILSGHFETAVKLYPQMYWAFETLLVLCALLCVRREKQIRLLWGAMFVSLLVTDCHMIYMLLHGVHRPSGFLNSHLATSALHALLIPPLAVFSVDKKIDDKTRLVCRGLLSVALVGAFIIGTRGIWVALPPVLIVAFAYGGGGWKRALRWGAVCVLGVLVLAAIDPANTRSRVSSSALQGSSVTARLAMYEGAVRIFLDHPVFGVGMTNFHEQWREQYCPPDKPAWKKFTHPHNIYFQSLAEGGLVGFAGFSAMFGYPVWWSWKRRRTRRGLLLFCSTVSFLLYGLTDIVLWSHEATRAYWLMLGVAFSEEAIVLTERQSGEHDEKHSAD